MRLSLSGLKADNPARIAAEASVSFQGTTDNIGAATGLTIRCGALANEPSYANHALKLLNGAAAGQVRDIALHPAGTDTITVSSAFTDNTGAVVQVPAGVRFFVISIPPAIAELGDMVDYLWIPKVQMAESWQTLAIDPVIWTPTDPATGAAWAAGTVGTILAAASAPNANETARLRSNHQWISNPGVFGVNTIVQRLRLCFEAQFTNIANIDNTLSILGGLSAGGVATRATDNIIVFGLVGDALQTISDVGGVEETNTGFGETLTNWNKFRIDVSAGLVAFYLNEALIASHVVSFPDLPMFLNFFLDTEAGGAAAIRIGQVICLQEVKL